MVVFVLIVVFVVLVILVGLDVVVVVVALNIVGKKEPLRFGYNRVNNR